MERDDVCNGAKVGRPPDYLVRPGIGQTARLRSTRCGPDARYRILAPAIEFAVIRFRELTVWLMQLK